MANNDNLTVLPAYGRDYNSQTAVQAAWDEGKDFIIQGFGGHGRAVNKQDADNPDYGTTGYITIRYAKATKAYNVKR